jgi:AcrR family transcriptional regulator
MPNAQEFLKNEPEQARSKKAIVDLFEAATLLAITGDANKLNVRALSQTSGYSVGSIYHYFSKIDDLFSYVFNMRREKVHRAFAKNIRNFDPSSTVNNIFEKLVDDSFAIWKQPHPQLLNKMLRQYLKRVKDPERFNTIADMLVPAFLEAMRNNQSKTFRSIDESELRILLRMTQQAIGAPFVEQDPIAGTAEHRKIAIESCCRLFEKATN